MFHWVCMENERKETNKDKPKLCEGKALKILSIFYGKELQQSNTPLILFFWVLKIVYFWTLNLKVLMIHCVCMCYILQKISASKNPSIRCVQNYDPWCRWVYTYAYIFLNFFFFIKYRRIGGKVKETEKHQLLWKWASGFCSSFLFGYEIYIIFDLMINNYGFNSGT